MVKESIGFPVFHVHSKTRSWPATIATADEQEPLNMTGAGAMENLGTAQGHGGSGASKSSNTDNSVGPAEIVTKMRPREVARAANIRNKTLATLGTLTRTAVWERRCPAPGRGRGTKSPLSQGESSIKG